MDEHTDSSGQFSQVGAVTGYVGLVQGLEGEISRLLLAHILVRYSPDRVST